jgi:D-alanine-D-alanine ligase
VGRTVGDCEAFSENPPFEYPLFIKPVAERGSAGIDETSIVDTHENLTTRAARRLDRIGQPVLVERFLQWREITWGIPGNNENAGVLPPLEIVCRKGDLALRYNKKERDDDAFLCPAPLSEDEAKMTGNLAIRAYRPLGFKTTAGSTLC